jgi:two-component system alkaline phosphatase synthesis response regulator PhoP
MRGKDARSLSVDHAARTVRCDGQSVPLTAREYEILLALLDANGGVVTRERLLERIGVDPVVGFRDRRVDVHVSNLRGKLASLDPHRDFVQTRTGIGYRLDLDP